MTSPAHNEISGNGGRKAEDTLRLIAALPAPDGLADRVHLRLSAAPHTSSLLRWPAAPLLGYRIQSPAFRTAAAAAIVCLVAGGGWQICSHVQTSPGTSAIVQPARVGDGGRFSNAGAMRTPDTLDRPVWTHAVSPAQPDSVAPSSASPAVSAKKHKAAKRSGKTPPLQR